jgi:transmembrane sensor
MSATEPDPAAGRDEAIEDAAANWLVRFNAGLNPREHTEFQQWLAADSRHAAAYAGLAEAWSVLNHPRTSGHADDLDCALAARWQRRARRRRIFAFAGAGLAAAAALVIFFLTLGSPPATQAPPATTVAKRPDRQVLPDGSTVELKAGAQIAVDFTATKRGVRLVVGEAMFAVNKDAARPFVVAAGGVEVRAVGTAFSVRHTEGQVGVLVTEGRVAVERITEPPGGAPADRPAAPPVAFLDAGTKLVVPADLPPATPLEIKPITSEQVATELAWRGKRVELSGTPLAEAVELFNRHNRLQIAVADPSLARHKLSGIFWADDAEGFVRLLETGMGVAAERSADTIVLRRK